jgi:hypothetical protein
MPDLEGPDELIPLRRAAEIAGVSIQDLRRYARQRRLRTIRRGQRYLTTRRWLHAYLMSRKPESGREPLPPDYVAPGEEST